MAFIVPAEVIAIFRAEVRECFDAITDGVAVLEGGPLAEARDAAIQDIARKLHNIKGAASSVGLADYSKVAHATEDMLLREARDQQELAPGLALLVRAVAWMQDALDDPEVDAAPLLATLARGPEHPAVEASPAAAVAPAPEAAAPQAAPATGDEMVRVEVAALERLLRPLAVLVTQGNESRYHTTELRELIDSARGMARLAAQGELASSDAPALLQLASQIDRHTRSLENSLRVIGHAGRDFEDQIRDMRLVPLVAVEKSFALIVRDAAERSGKPARFVLQGGQVGVDRRTLEALRPSLTHLLRNAVDHGLESAAERTQAGKPARGTVTLRAESRGDTLLISVTDDGGGVDRARVLATARQRGLAEGDSGDELSDDALLELLASHGFSTAREVTELSGRGVGLDVVRRQIRLLGGKLSLRSTLGSGTRFELGLPARLLTSRVLQVRAGGQLFGLPLAGIEAAARVAPASFFSLEGQTCVELAGAPARVRRLGAESRDDGEDGQQRQPALLVRTAQGPLALLVDAIVGEDDVVVEPLGPPLRRLPGVQGATLIESGKVMLVLNPAELHALGQSVAHGEVARPAARQPLVLVVDDSITTRTLERHILESHGYRVLTATDGSEALQLLRTESVDIVVSDVEMPNVTGLELARTVRADPALAELPLVLVTSRRDEEDRRRGLSAGADAYIVKQNFDQTVLLQTVAELLARGS